MSLTPPVFVQLIDFCLVSRVGVKIDQQERRRPRDDETEQEDADEPLEKRIGDLHAVSHNVVTVSNRDRLRACFVELLRGHREALHDELCRAVVVLLLQHQTGRVERVFLAVSGLVRKRRNAHGNQHRRLRRLRR